MTDQPVRITTKGMLWALGDVEVGRSRQSPGSRQSRLLAALRHSPRALRRRNELVEYICGVYLR